jgi:hypothetical protein
MSFNGSGTYTLPGAALTTGATVSSTENNTFRNDVATAFNKTSTRDGQTVPTANLPMGGFKHTGLAAGTAAGDSVRFEQFSSPPAIGDVAPNTGKFTTLTTTGNTILGDASTDTLNVGNGDLVKDASGNVGIGTSSPESIGSFSMLQVGQTNTGIVQTYDGTTKTAMYGTTGVGYIATRTNHPLAFNTNGSERARIDTSGNLLVGTTSQIQTGKISQTGGSFAGTNAGVVFDGGRLTSNGDIAYFRSTTTLAGYITITGANTCTYNSVSDVRLKENIVDAPSALAKVESLQVRSFDWKDGTGAVPFGFIAQELNEVVPEAVSHGTTNEDGSMLTPWGIDTSLLVPYLTKAIQEQQALITTLTERITALEAK